MSHPAGFGAATGSGSLGAMDLDATVADPLTGPLPADWERFAEQQALPLGWDTGLIRAAAACAQAATSLVVVHDQSSGEPVALYHARHVGAADPRRYATPGLPARPAVADVRLTPSLDTGVAFADRLDEEARAEAVRAFERALRRRGAALVRYCAVPAGQLAALRAAGLRRVTPSHRMVLDREWSDLDGYLATLPRKVRSQVRRRYDEIDRGDRVRFAVEDAVDPQEACWLSERVRRRLGTGRLPFPPWPPGYFARLNELPRARYLTYRDRHGRLLAYATVYHNGPELVSGIWGYLDEAHGGQRDLYFDVYLRHVEVMIQLGCQRLVLGQGMEHVKTRFGARPESVWTVTGPPAPPRWAGPRRALLPPPTVVRLPQTAPRPSRDPEADRPAWSPACPQCGERNGVAVRAGRRRVRLWCRRCHAVARVPVRWASAVAAAAGPDDGERVDAPPPPAVDAAAGEGTPVAEVVPTAMLRWFGDRMPSADRLTKGVICQLYRRWDAHLAKLSDEERHALAAPGEPAPVAGLPTFDVVLSTVQLSFYRVGRAVAQLVGRLPDQADAAAVAALEERARHALRWLSRYGQAECWLLDESGTTPPVSAVVEARDTLSAGAPLSAAATEAAREALFGTRRWPGIGRLTRAYPVATLVEALDAYLRDGSRPLREEALARLAGRLVDAGDAAQTTAAAVATGLSTGVR